MFSRKVISIIKLAFVTVVAVFVAVAAVFCFAPKGFFGWFANNKSVSANGMNVSVESPTEVIDTATCYVHNNTNNTFVLNENQAIEFETYSLLNNNVYQAIIKITLKVSSVTVYAHTTASDYLGSQSAELLKETENSLSSIIAFEVYYSDDSPSVITDNNSTITFTPNNPTDYSFLTEDENNNNVLVSSKSVQLGETHNFSGAEPYAVYVVIKYNSAAIEEISSKNLGNSAISNLDEVPFNVFDFSLQVV